MIEFKITIERKIFNDALATLGQTQKHAEDATRRTVVAAQPRIQGKMQAPSNVPDLPFVWSLDPSANARARRWYFANKVPKGSKGGRYQRTGALVAGMDVSTFPVEDGINAAITTTFDRFGYVIGEQQVPSHQKTPWFNLDDIVSEESPVIADDISERWLNLMDGEIA